MLLEGKRGLIVGVANKRSLAWGIAQSASREGARLAITYQGERLEKNVRKLAEELESPIILPCDVTKEEELHNVADTLQSTMSGIDFVIHAVAYALREELDGQFLDTSREGYRIAQDVSSYSLIALSRCVVPLMPSREEGGGSIVTLTYLGGRTGRSELQRYGCCESRTGDVSPISGGGRRAQRCSGKCDLSGAD